MIKTNKIKLNDIGYLNNKRKDILINHIDSFDFLENINKHKPVYLETSENQKYIINQKYL